MPTASVTIIPLFDNLTQLPTNRIPISSPPLKHLSSADYQLSWQFLVSYRGTQTTFNAYRRELERLLQWCEHIQHKSLIAIDRNDIEQFIEFCQKPPRSWISHKQVQRFKMVEGQRVANLEWRPFVATVSKQAHRRGQQADSNNYLLSAKALQAIFAILSSFFQFLLQENYVSSNPVMLLRQKSKYLRKTITKAPIIRKLSELQWSYVIETAEIMASENPAQHERTLFIMNALYGLYLRVSELAASDRWVPLMSHFQRDSDGNWWFHTVGKGNKERNISVSNAMLSALKRYRRAVGLTSLPTVGETTPLICKLKGRGPVSCTRQIRNIVQVCFDNAIDRLRGDRFIEEAEQMQSATVHWLRHTGISEDVKTRPREHVRDDAGHSSSSITDRYIDVELRQRHASAKHKVIKPL